MMRNFLLFLTLLVCVSCATTKSNRNSYQVVRIDSVRSYYLLYASKDGNVYKIFSKKAQPENYTKRIEAGKNYNFKLIPFFGRDAERGAKGVTLPDSVTLCLEDGCLPNIYYSSDIEGLYVK